MKVCRFHGLQASSLYSLSGYISRLFNLPSRYSPVLLPGVATLERIKVFSECFFVAYFLFLSLVEQGEPVI
jgi:hypothetical protein